MAKMLRRVALVVGVIVVVPVAYVGWVFVGSRPVLEGTLQLAGLSAPAEIVRDEGGVPTVTAANRLDLARALGFVHGQERFFQMDLLRRAGAGELSALVGDVAMKVDRARRRFRFRVRAVAAVAAQAPADRALLDAYTDGVNAGLAALRRAPWEYALLRVPPAPWTDADTVLVTDAMYFDLEDSDADEQVLAAREQRVLGPELANFLYPRGSPLDAPLDGSHLPEAPVPSAPAATGPAAPAAPPRPEKGSNNFAVAGRLSDTGAAIIENDMHLDLRVPDIWFRARLRVAGGLDMVGVTLPGVPFAVVGSNTHVAWAFTDSFIETGDAVVIEQPPGDAAHYRTPQGLRAFETHVEKVCAAHGACEDLPVRDTIWGPIVGRDDAGHEIAWRWIAEDPKAVTINSFLALEGARTVREALDAAHEAGLPDQNFVVGDSAGHIGWTIIGPVPRRIGLNDQMPHSWADGSHGWNGFLPPGAVPEVVDPPDGRLWSANARTMGGAALALLGDGFYANPARARAIHDDLFARDRFAEIDMLHIATDDRAHVLDPWQTDMIAAIAAHAGDAGAAGLRAYVADWGGAAAPDSIGYRLVRDYRGAVIKRVYQGLAGGVAAAPGDTVPIARQADYVALRLLAARPPALIPKPFASWDALVAAALDEVAARAASAPGGLAAYRWGVRNHTGIHHPLAEAVPGLGWLTDPPDVPVAGDALVPRVATPGFGASERLVVSPGHEDRGIFEMPAGQSDNPLTPYYGAGEAAWVNGAPAKLLPGPARWRLTLTP
jgi:penicillin amidase